MEDKQGGHLVRGLGPVEATTLVAGGIIGTSIFLITSNIATIVGHPALVLVTWLLAGLLAGAAALCFAELSAAIPKSGGTYVFLKRAYGSDLLAFSFVWAMAFAYSTGAIAVVAIMGSTYLMVVLQAAGVISGDYISAGAIALIGVLTALNASGVRRGGLAQNAITFLKIALVLTLIMGAWILGQPHLARISGASYSMGTSSDIISNVNTALILCLFSYNGAFFVTHVAEEIRDPQKNIPRAIIFGFTTVVVVYLTMNVTYLSVMTFDEVRASERIAGDMAAMLVGPIGGVITAFIICWSAIGVLNAQLLNYARIPFALARDRLFFRGVDEIHPRSGVPTKALLLVGAVACLFAMTGSYTQILGYVAFVVHFYISLAVLAVIVLRIREPDLHRPYRVWGYPVTPVAFLLVSVVYLYNLVATQLLSVLVGVAIVAAGLPFYFYWRKNNDSSTAEGDEPAGL